MADPVKNITDAWNKVAPGYENNIWQLIQRQQRFGRSSRWAFPALVWSSQGTFTEKSADGRISRIETFIVDIRSDNARELASQFVSVLVAQSAEYLPDDVGFDLITDEVFNELNQRRVISLEFDV